MKVEGRPSSLRQERPIRNVQMRRSGSTEGNGKIRIQGFHFYRQNRHGSKWFLYRGGFCKEGRDGCCIRCCAKLDSRGGQAVCIKEKKPQRSNPRRFNQPIVHRLLEEKLLPPPGLNVVGAPPAIPPGLNAPGAPQQFPQG